MVSAIFLHVAALLTVSEALVDKSVQEIQELLVDWKLDHAFAQTFASQKYDGDVLSVISKADIDEEFPHVSAFHRRALFTKIASFRESEVRRELKDVDLSGYVGLDVTKDKAKLSLGEKKDVNLWRDPKGGLNFAASKINYVTPEVNLPTKVNVGTGSMEQFIVNAVKANIKSNILLCSPGFTGSWCNQKCTNAKNNQYYVSPVTKGKNCAVTACTNANPGQYYVGPPGSTSTCAVNACSNKPATGSYYTSSGGTSATGCKTGKWISSPTLLGRFDIPVEYKGSPSKTAWVKVNARTGIGFTFGDYPEATKIRGCMTFTDSSSGKGKVYARLREAGGKNQVYFTDNYGETYSGSGLIHHECGAWQDIKKITCGYSWGNDCQVDIQHTQGVSLQIYGFDFEVATDKFPSKIAAGLFDLPITYSKAGTKQYSRWSKAGKAARAVGFSLNDYAPNKGNGKLYARACLTFTDSSSGKGTVHVKVRRSDDSGVIKTLSGGDSGSAKNLKACTGECDNDAQCAKGLKCFQRTNGERIPGCKGAGGGKSWDYCYDPNWDKQYTYFEDDFSHTWSGSGLIHHECGKWVDASTVSCGYSWSNTCQVDLKHTQGVNLIVYDYDIELASTTTSKAPVYMGRFDVPVSYEGKPSKTAWVKVNAKTGIGFSFHDYPGATKIRGCMSFTDSSSGKGKVYARLREAGGKNQVYFTDNYGETWSGSGLVHHECGAWQDLSKVTCGYSWGNDCQVDIQHTQGVSLTIYEFDFELARVV